MRAKIGVQFRRTFVHYQFSVLQMAILRLKDQEHLMDPAATLCVNSSTYMSAMAEQGTPRKNPANASVVVKEEIVIHADPLSSSAELYIDERQQQQVRRQSELSLSSSNSSSPRDYSASVGAYHQNWSAEVSPPHQQQQRQHQLMMMEEEGSAWPGHSVLMGSMKKKRKPVNLCIQCPVCGGPAPDHMHFGGEERGARRFFIPLKADLCPKD